MTHLLAIAAEFPQIIVLAAVVVAGLTGFVCAYFAWKHRMERSRNQDQLRREIAAYVAEGSMTAEEGERLMRAAGDEE